MAELFDFQVFKPIARTLRGLTAAELSEAVAEVEREHGCTGLHSGPCRYPFRKCDGGFEYAIGRSDK